METFCRVLTLVLILCKRLLKILVSQNQTAFFLGFPFFQLMSSVATIPLAKALSFAANDPSMGDASISYAPLSPAQSATYQCKVRESPGAPAPLVRTGFRVASSAH